MAITMYQGDTKVLAYTVKDAAGAAVDLTSSTIRWQLAKSVSKAADVTKITGDGIEITDAEEGLFEVALDPEDTEDLAHGNYYFEAEVTDSSGNISTVSTGTLTLNRTLIKA